MIGSFHESMISSRHQSISGGGGDGNLRSNSIDENSYDDLTKVRKNDFQYFDKRQFLYVFQELVILRKEREQDKQTIKLLQEQMVCFIFKEIFINNYYYILV